MTQTGQTLSTSMFYMWRCVIAVAHNHADGKVTGAEHAYLAKVFAGMDRAWGLTPEQKKTFADDIETPQNIADLLPHINDPEARGQLIYFAGLCVHADGHADPAEDALLKKLRTDQLAGLDLQQVHADVNRAVASDMWKLDLERGQQRPQKGLGAIIDDFLLWMGVDLFSA